MTPTQVRENGVEDAHPRHGIRPQTTALLMLSVVLLAGALVAIWFIWQGRIDKIFRQLAVLGQTPPLWLEVPMVAGQFLLFPTVILLMLVLAVMRVTPRHQTWSRLVVISILLALTIRYLMWRGLSTLNFMRPLDGLFSISLFLLELLTLGGGILQLVLMLNLSDRHPKTDEYAQDVIQGRYTPTVDILIPTYNEPAFILRRTIVGCQFLNYPHKTIYLLDDTRRPEIAELARSLGCQYLTRPDNRHAKAGNLNHAIARTSGELIVVFDADFIPTQNFLSRTIGFFQDPSVALVQTPQSFYNPDPIARNLGLENVLTSEEEIFYRQIQPIRNAVGSVICSGTSFVVRRSALEETGGFFTDSLSEDYFTGIRLSARGYRLIYLDEKLSAGLAAENIAAHATQRLRWARGTLQAFFVKANPLTIPGLTPLQRLAHFEGLLHWFTSFSQVGFLLMPLAYSLFAVIPIRATTAEILYFFLPFYLVQTAAFSWLNYRSRSALLTNVYSLVLCFPLSLTVVQVLLNPFSTGFKVTPKGTVSDRFSFNWALAWPLLLLFILTAASLWFNLGMCFIKGDWATTVPPEMANQIKGIGLGWIWSLYNLIMLGIALLILLDAPRPHHQDWFDLRRTVQLQVDGTRFWGVTTMLSEVGVEIALTQAGFSTDPSMSNNRPAALQLTLMEDNLTLTGTVVRTGMSGEFPTIRVLFEPLSLEQERRLIELLFCRPGQWKHRQSPGELQSLLLLFRILLRPRFLFDRNVDVSAMTVAKV